MITIKKRKISKYIILTVIIILICSLVLIMSKGKYVIKDNTFHIQNSENFYFESDVLTGEESEITYYDWDKTREYTIEFMLRNYIDELQFNNLETTYEIEVTSDDEDANIRILINNVETSLGTMNANIKQEDKVEIKISSNKSSVNLYVEANSKSPYEKKIFGEFNLVSEYINYEYDLVQDEEKDYVELIIQTNNFEGNLKVAYNSLKVTPDMNYRVLEDVLKVQIEDTSFYYLELDLDDFSNYQIDFIKKVLTDNITIGNSINNADIVVGYR